MWFKALSLVVLISIFSCGGELSKEQREMLKTGMRTNKVRRVTPAQLTEAAFRQGGLIAKEIQEKDPNLIDPTFRSSIGKSYGARVYLLRSSTGLLDGTDQKLLEAYTSVTDASDLKDNVQKIGTDTLLYTLPVTYERPDGSSVFSHALAIRMATKSIINSLPKKY